MQHTTRAGDGILPDCFGPLKNLCLVLASALSVALPATGADAPQLHQHIRARYDAVLSLTDLPRGALFLPSQQFEAPDSQTQTQADHYAEELVQLASDSLSDNPSFAYQLLHEAAYYGRENLADKIVNGKPVDFRSKLGTSSHPRLKWKRRSYFRVTSAHYQVVTRDEQAGMEIAKRLERLHAVWRQLFLECWSNEDELRNALTRGKTLIPKSRRLHRVVLFASRGEYTEFLEKSQPRIGITKGFYDLAARTSYFFASPERSNHSSQYHEVTHQLFQEIQRASERVALAQNFWAIEGIAMYMESLQHEQAIARVGGQGARRLQFARYRRLQEDFYVPLRELATYGRRQIQRDKRIRRIYTQSAGLTHLFMDTPRYRAGFIRYLKTIYQGRDRADSLSGAMQSEYATLDRQYKQFLNVDDERLVAQRFATDQLRSLCIGGTKVTNEGLLQLASQSKLEWLDLAQLPVQVSGLKFIRNAKSLKQLSFDQCPQIDDSVLEWLKQNRDLEELDLTATDISDDGLRHLAGLSKLRILWVGGTQITDAALPVLTGLSALETLGCEGTKISAAGLQSLRQRNPNLTIQ